MSDGILSDRAIMAGVREKSIVIDPFDADNLNPASYDVTLGDGVCVYSRWVGDPSGPDMPWRKDGSRLYAKDEVLDVSEEPQTMSYTMNAKDGWFCRPGIGYLLHTRESVGSHKYVAVLDGKSSIARLFVPVHFTAGYIDPGFFGQLTMEVTVTHPVRLFPGMRIGQVRFHTIHGVVGAGYGATGHYTGAFAKGAVPSQAWRQFRKEDA